MKKHVFILVHIGKKFPDYINDCLKQIKTFNDSLIFLVIPSRHNKNINVSGIIIENTEKLISTAKHKYFIKNNSLNHKFRDGFWESTTERFFYIEEIMIKYNLDNVIHIENDNLIYVNIDDYIDIFESNYRIAAVFDNDNRCIPCFMYFKDVISLSKLTEFICLNPNKTDMESISLYKQYYSEIENLPVIPKDYELKSQTGLITINREQYSNKIDLFNSVFDGAAIGQYLGGVDPRNIDGNTIGFINESALYDVSQFNYLWIEDYKRRKVPYLEFNKIKYRINNLHIHSKDLFKYMS